jgi:hypothetical protein
MFFYNSTHFLTKVEGKTGFEGNPLVYTMPKQPENNFVGFWLQFPCLFLYQSQPIE